MSTTALMGTCLTERHCRRSWPDDLKRAIVAASYAAGASVSVIARQYDVNANQVFAWRKRFRNEHVTFADQNGSALVPVIVTAQPPEPGTSALTTSATIEITGIGSYRIRLDGGVDGALLSCVLDVLERR